ncbi:MAG: response regulator [Candidatus Zixiibacteriota bacterium]
MKVLLLTDSAGKLSELVSWLEDLGRQVVMAFSPRRALRILHSDHTIDLVIAEASASRGHGSKLLQSVKQDPRTKSIPVIIVDTQFDDAVVRDYLQKGIDDIVMLPIAKETFEAKIRNATDRGKETILVVDDEPLIRDLLEQFLLLERYKPICVESAERALEVLKEQPIDAVITDIMMEGMSGIDLLVKVKEFDLEIPVIMITGFAGSYGPQELISMGADGYFTKPFHNVDLIYTLRQVLNRARCGRSHRKPVAG